MIVELLLLFSFLLHGLTFVLFRQWKSKQTKLEELEKNVQDQVKSMEELLSFHLMELKEENHDFMKQLQNQQMTSVDTHAEEASSPETAIEKEKSKETTTPEIDVTTNTAPQYTDSKHLIQTDGEHEDTVEASETAQVLHYYGKGLSADDIARKLHMGKTEVELLLKFHQNETNFS
ncbi:hypothetical protein J416_00654 [Gracilibacillus halophilus YIM-C55.5]|uniref:Coupling factor for flagellin transcription and translation n=1 Tax=Gracilibacillus halophilus YIM-C55.5 TaxID=1308866 RepID=N4WV25_9BACI|nr:hypothetical protein [Gracilibacillus halophilus]ENH98210.1 hypothetical protein J416_00654 [Gracilibacillus halophilus YIM-C55.5]